MKTIRFTILAACFLILAACNEIFEKNINSKQVHVITPVDNITAPDGTVNFLWRKTDGATAYHFTLVSPDFAQASILVADTILMNDSVSHNLNYSLELQEGNYQWNIRALNSAYTTHDNINTLFVKQIQDKDDNEEHDEGIKEICKE